MLDDLKYLKVDLPEDILKIKYSGNLDGALKQINFILKGRIPESLKKRLQLEKNIISLLSNEYPYSFKEALKIMQDNIKDFTEEELTALQHEGVADWFLINGKVKFNESFYGNIIKTKPEIKKRLIVRDDSEKKREQYLDDNIKYMKSNESLKYRIHLKTTIQIKKEAAEIGKKIKIHVPLPISCQQVDDIRIIKTIPECKYISPVDYPQRTAYFENTLRENQEFSVEYEYINKVNYVQPNSDLAVNKCYKFDIGELEPHIIFTPYIKELAAEIMDGESNPIAKARKIYDFITTNVKYSFVRKYSTIENIPEYAALNLKGDCGVQGLLFITLCRCVGIPSKWQSGLAVTPYHIGCHDWTQFYIEPYGWLFADPSFGGGAYRTGNLEKWNFYFGNLDPFRMIAASEFQHKFDPPKKYDRHDPYDNQVGECEYEDRGLLREEYEVNWNLIDMQKIYDKYGI